jgi:phosphatidylinositol-3,4,5-trisphosphate 3-phosphatase/dual-specificity protein phosphatase PTEN
MVSQNRKRFQTQDFNLDLAYISKRVIAMGFPAFGLRSIYRNPAGEVLEFFKKHHENRVKVYNLCDDSFIDMNQLQFIDGQVNIAYFPMADHNPGSVKLLFEMILDMLLFMS